MNSTVLYQEILSILQSKAGISYTHTKLIHLLFTNNQLEDKDILQKIRKCLQFQFGKSMKWNDNGGTARHFSVLEWLHKMWLF